MEFAGVVEAEDMIRLLVQVLFGSREETKGGVSLEDGLQVGEPLRVVLDGICSGAVLFAFLLLVLFGGFGDEERGGKVGGGEEGGERGMGLGFIRV